MNSAAWSRNECGLKLEVCRSTPPGRRAGAHGRLVCGVALIIELVDVAPILRGRSPNIASDVRVCYLMY